METRKNFLNILVLEDNPADAFLLGDMLQTSDLNVNEVFTAERITEALELLSSHHIDLIFLDLSLPDSFGINTFIRIKTHSPQTPVIILTGLSESAMATEALKEGAQDYLVKGEFDKKLLVKCATYSIERKKAEQRLVISEQNYKQLFDSNPFPSWIYERDSLQILEVNNAAIEKYGYERNEFLALSLEELRPSEVVAEMWHSVKDRGHSQIWQKKIWAHQKKCGEIMMMEVTFFEINFSGRMAIQAQMNDVTEKIMLEKELTRQRKVKQKEITDAVLKAQEKERNLIAEELHDNINQILATARLFLSSSIQEDEIKVDLIHKGKEFISLAIEEIRKLSKALLVPFYIKAGLKSAIEVMMDNILLAKDIKVITRLDVLDTIDIHEDLKITIYRILQEQLQNILKHADASRITISITVVNDYLLLSVTDNGKGFDTSTQSDGIGITNINSRVALFNGNVEMESSPGNGCKLKVFLKYKMEATEKVA